MSKEMTIKQNAGRGFADQLPDADPMLGGALNPRAEEVKKYKEMFFDPKYDGFGEDLEYVCDLPYRASKDVESSPLGVGFEVLDHRTAYDFTKALAVAKDSGVKWARIQSGWQRAETVPGVYNFDWLDEIVDGLRSEGIQPWVSLSFGNGLYMDAVPVPPHDTYLFSPTLFGEKCINAWENYCKAMVEHFKGRVSHWEVWNEPNAGFLRKVNWKECYPMGNPPEVYVDLVKITAEAVRSVQPEAKILGGAISGCAICNEYIQGLFDNGIADYIDAFTYHPYQGIPEFDYPERLQFIRDLIDESGRNITLWMGENGRPSDSALLGNGFKNTEGSQARFLTRRYLTDLRMGMEVSSYFTICDFGNGYIPGKLFPYGIVDISDPENYRPKLAFRAMQSFANIFDSKTKLVHGNFEIKPLLGWGGNTWPAEVASGISCAFRRGNVPIFAYYHPTHIDADWQVKPIRADMYVPDGLTFNKPILIDPITARVYRIKKMAHWTDGNWGYLEVLPKLPLLDYPLLVSDASLLDTLK